MNIPAFTLTQNNELYHDNLSQTLIGGLSDNGWTSPSVTTDDITNIAPSMPDGTFWYDNVAGALKVKIAGIVKTVTVA